MNANLPNVWREVSAIAPVAPAEIQVWRVNLIPPPAEISRLEKFLTPDEIKLAAQFHFAHDQRRFVVRRAVLRQLLAGKV